MTEIVPFPWNAPATVETTVRDLQRDVAYMVSHTGVLVRSSRLELEMLVNTARGQIVPREEVTFSDGTTLEFVDIGMPQPGAPAMSVKELVLHVMETTQRMGLKL